MRHFKLTALLAIIFCVFIAVPSYCEVSKKPKKTTAKQEARRAKKEKQRLERENQKQISALYKKALSYYFKGELTESKNTFEEVLAIAPDEKKAKRYIDKKIPAKEKRIAEARAKKQALLQKKALTSNVKKSSKPKKKSGKKSTVKKDEPRDISRDVSEVATIVSSGSPRGALDEKVRYLRADSGWEYDATRQKGIKFTFNTNANYDSNIYLTNADRVADVVTHLMPGVYGFYGNENHLIYGFYDTDIQIYGLHPQDTRMNQRVGAKLLLFKNNPLKIMVSDTFQPTSAPATSEIAPFVKRVHNNFIGTIRWDMSPKTSVAVSYDQNLQNYVQRTYEKYSYLEHTVNPVLYWHLSPKTSITADYQIAAINYYKPAKDSTVAASDFDSVFNQVRVGIEGNLTPKSKIFFRTGYQYRRYTASATPARPSLKDVNAWVMEGVYDWAVGPKTSVNIVASRDVNESTFQAEGYYQSLNLFASINQRLFNNLDATGRGFYIRSDYPYEVFGENTSTGVMEPLERVDNLYGIGGEVAYNFASWLSIFASYDYKIRWSNMVAYNYKDNQFRWGAKANF